MSEPAILFIKPKAINKRDAKLLRDAGVLVVEIADPSDAKFVLAHAELDGSQMLHLAMKAIKSSQVARDAFGALMNAALLESSTSKLTPGA